MSIDKLEEKAFKCYECDGYGYTSEHDPHDPHEIGCSNCPIQVQCESCHGGGMILKLSDAIEVIEELKDEKDKEIGELRELLERAKDFIEFDYNNIPMVKEIEQKIKP